MAIRIPTAQELGFGQRLPDAIPEVTAPRPSVSTPVDKSGTTQAISGGLNQMGNILMDYGLEQYRHNETMKLMEEEKLTKLKLIEDQKVMEAQKAAEKSAAQVEMLNFQSLIQQGVKDIASRQDDTPEQKTAAFNEHIKGMEDKYKEAIPDDLKPHFAPLFAGYAIEGKSKLTEAITKQAEDKQVADGALALAKLENLAAANPSKIEEFKKNARDLITGLPLHETVKVSQIQKFESTLDKNDILSRLNVLGKDGYRSELASVLSDLTAKGEGGAFAKYAGLDPSDRDALIKTAQTMSAMETRQKEADRKAAIKEHREYLKETLEAYKDQKLSGLPVTPKDELRIAKLVKGTEFEGKYEAIKTQGESAEHIFKKLSEDPLTFGAARLGEQVKPLNLTDPQQMAQGIAERMRIGAKVKSNLGLTFTPLLTGDEIKGLTGFLKKDPKGGIEFMDKLTRQLGARSVTGMAMQMSKEEPGLATVMKYVASGDTLMAKQVAKGQELIETKALKMPKEDDLSGLFRSEAGEALRGLPNNAAEPYNAFKAAYANAAQVAGIHDGTFDRNLARIAFRQVVGNVVEFNGAKTMLPKDVKEEDFINSVKRISSATVKQLGGVHGMTDEAAARAIREDGQFYLAGDGVYRVLVDGLPLRTADQKRFMQFNLKSLDFTHP